MMNVRFEFKHKRSVAIYIIAAICSQNLGRLDRRLFFKILITRLNIN